MADILPTDSNGLANRLEFETLISDTSAALLAAPPDQLEPAIEKALERVGAFFQADRCALLSVSADRQMVHVHHAFYAEGASHVAPDINLAEFFPWSHRRLIIEGEPIRIARMDELPPEADVEREVWLQMSIRSALTLPIMTGGEIRYLILLNTVHHEREWPDAFVTRLRVLGEVLVSALERQTMMNGLREAEERMHLAADSAEAGFWTLDFTTGIFWSTEKGRAIFGIGPEEVIDIEHFTARIHPDDRDRVSAVIERARCSPDPIDLEYRVVLPGDGNVRWITSRGRPRFSAAGEAEQLTGVSVDVTRRKRAQAELSLSEVRLSSGADLAGLAFYEVDFTEGTAYFDGRIHDLCGVPPEWRQGAQPLEFWLENLHPDDRTWVLEMRDQMHEGTLIRPSLEYRYLHPVHGLRWIQHLAGVTRRDTDGQAEATFGVLRDITTRKQNEFEMRDLSRRLIRAHEDERALLARELHDDVTQRLAVLAIDIGRAESAAPESEQAQAMRTAREGLVSLSEDIHSLAYQLHPSVLAELGLVEALRTECEHRTRQGRIQVSADLQPMPTGVGKDTALCLFRVAQEALNNVARHAGTRGVYLTLRQTDGGVLLAVRDDGEGFDLASRNPGQSLGLASMRERVRLVEGTLDIESAPGQGTTVTVWVPTEGKSP